MMKEKRLSNKSFIKTSKRFVKKLNIYIESLYEDCDKSVSDKILSEIKYHNQLMVDKLILSYKRNPYRDMSAFTHKMLVFKNIDDVVSIIKVAYLFDENTVTFKYSQKYKRRFKRKFKFVLKFKNDNVKID